MRSRHAPPLRAALGRPARIWPVLIRTGLARACLLGAVLAGFAAPASALEVGKYRFELDAEVRTVRAHDLDGDGRKDLVVIGERVTDEDREWVVFVLRSPKRPRARTFFAEDDIVRFSMRELGPGVAAIAVGRFGPQGEMRIRFIAADGSADRDLTGKVTGRTRYETLLGRTGGQPIIFWDAVADLDGDGRDEMWFPNGAGDGAIRVHSGRGSVRTLTIPVNNQGTRSAQHGMLRTAYIPKLVPADLDGDGRRELVALDDNVLLGWPGVAPEGNDDAAPVAPTFELDLPFLQPDPDLAPEAMRAPRIQLEDVDGDGIADMLVTLISGRRDRLGSFRTTLFHYPGPFQDPDTGKLVPHRARIDTESVALHPSFVDIDGDGALDYVGDSIRGSRVDLIARLMGHDPDIYYVGFRFDRRSGTFASTPLFTLKRVYPSSEALSNTFGCVAWFAGDFDGDGVSDLLDVGNLTGVEIVRGTPKQGNGPGDPLAFTETLMPRIEVEGGILPHGVIADLSGDERDDAVLWGEAVLYLVVPKGAK